MVEKTDKNDEIRVGVFVCHCGTNIAAVVSPEKLVEYAKKIPGVVFATDYRFMCSDPGQELIKQKIKEENLNRVVVAACSPRMHEATFRRVCREAGLNQFLFEQANIREQDSWVHMKQPDKALQIAKDHVRIAVAKAKNLQSLLAQEVDVEPTCLIVGGGIAGISAALDLATAGYKTYIIEKDTTIGGRMAQLDKTFPTMDCSACILTPKMVDTGQHPNIELLTYSEVKNVEGFVGNFEVTVEKKPRYIIEDKCTGCGECAQICPVYAPNEFDQGMAPRKAAYLPFPQAVPLIYTIDRDKCIECGLCIRVCESKAIDFDQKPETLTLKIGTIIITTGYDPYIPKIEEYGYGRYENVITGIQMERLLSSFGPTGGKVKRPSDLTEPKKVLFIHCVGSRNLQDGQMPYCSRVCCMYTAKQARQYKEKHPEAEIYVSFIDVRAFGKGYEEFYEIVQREYGVNYIRGRVAEIREDPKTKNLIARLEDTFLNRLIELEVNMVVLATAIVAREDAKEIIGILRLSTDMGFIMEAHPKLRPVDTLSDGIFVAGVAQGPKDIPDTVAQAKGAAASAIALMGKGKVEIEPYYSVVDITKCTGCRTCVNLCPYQAISMVRAPGKSHLVSSINQVLCKGCGTCAAACPNSAISQCHFNDQQVFAQILSALEEL